MFKSFPSLLLPALLTGALMLSGCKSSEEKAEDYYQSGLALLAQGDEERALVEFRNVFKYNGFHKDARKAYADTVLKEGKVDEAYSQYLRLIEQYPDTPEVREILAKLAIERGDWSEAERHGRAAIALAPDQPGVQAIKLVLDYRAAVLANDEAARSKTAEAAKALLAKQPDSELARRIVIDRLISGPDPQQALPVIEDALAQNPKSLEFHMLKFRLLAQVEDVKATGVELQQMYDLFPDNAQVKSALIAWYLVQKDLDGAEAFLRKLAGDVTGPAEGHLAVVQFLQAARGADVARAELDKLIAANSENAANAQIYQALRATLDFEAGKTTEAITAMEATVKTAEPSDQTRRIKAMLARMLDATANRVGARALVEEILVEDPSNVDALKQRAGWFIAEDKPGDAIVDLRAALGQAPRDPDILTLMAAAYERDGSLDLAGEQLARAVEVSGSAADESLRYAQFLLRRGRTQPAETVLTDARRVSPNNTALLRALGQYYIKQSQFSRAQEVVDALNALKLPEATNTAQTLQALMLNAQNRPEDSVTLLEDQLAKTDQTAAADPAVPDASAQAPADSPQTISAQVMIVQTQIQAGKTAEARAYLDAALLKNPKDKTLRLLSGNLDLTLGKPDLAEATYRSLIAEDAAFEPAVPRLYGLLQAGGRAAEAAAVLDAGLAAQPKSGTLRWLKAGALEQSGQIDAAIALYDALYAEDSSNTIIANNLASLITAHRDDDASLARAEAIARRLRELEVPAFQDTYGWIAFRRGNLDEALSHLEPAAKGLPQDMLTQFHLAMLYDKLGRSADAIRQFEAMLALAGNATLPQVTEARARLAALQTTLQTGAPAPANP